MSFQIFLDFLVYFLSFTFNSCQKAVECSFNFLSPLVLTFYSCLKFLAKIFLLYPVYLIFLIFKNYFWIVLESIICHFKIISIITLLVILTPLLIGTFFKELYKLECLIHTTKSDSKEVKTDPELEGSELTPSTEITPFKKPKPDIMMCPYRIDSKSTQEDLPKIIEKDPVPKITPEANQVRLLNGELVKELEGDLTPNTIFQELVLNYKLGLNLLLPLTCEPQMVTRVDLEAKNCKVMVLSCKSEWLGLEFHIDYLEKNFLIFGVLHNFKIFEIKSNPGIIQTGVTFGEDSAPVLLPEEVDRTPIEDPSFSQIVGHQKESFNINDKYFREGYIFLSLSKIKELLDFFKSTSTLGFFLVSLSILSLFNNFSILTLTHLLNWLFFLKVEDLILMEKVPFLILPLTKTVQGVKIWDLDLVSFLSGPDLTMAKLLGSLKIYLILMLIFSHFLILIVDFFLIKFIFYLVNLLVLRVPAQVLDKDLTTTDQKPTSPIKYLLF